MKSPCRMRVATRRGSGALWSVSVMPMKSLPPLVLFGALFASSPFTLTLAAQAGSAIAATAGTEGFGRATSYRQALAAALEDAVGKAKGIQVARGPGVRSRLSVVSSFSSELPEGWFDGESDHESEWVQQQISGFVQRYEIKKKEKAQDGQWEVTVVAQVAAIDQNEPVMVVAIDGNNLGKWQLDRVEEGGAGTPFARDGGDYQGPQLRENLLRSGAVKIAAGGSGVSLGSGASPREREKAGQQLVASHRISIQWQPMQLTSLVEKPNRARPTSGPRPEYLVSATATCTVTVVDLVQNVEVQPARPMVIAIELPAGTPIERRDAYVVKLADQANATIAEAVFFALRPPVVLRKWAGDGGAWLCEARMARRIANAYQQFTVGTPGSLASPDWQPLGGAALVGGNDVSCTFQLINVEDPARIEPDVTEIRPVRK
jgi:hypothetical protein